MENKNQEHLHPEKMDYSYNSAIIDCPGDIHGQQGRTALAGRDGHRRIGGYRKDRS